MQSGQNIPFDDAWDESIYSYVYSSQLVQFSLTVVSLNWNKLRVSRRVALMKQIYSFRKFVRTIELLN